MLVQKRGGRRTPEGSSQVLEELQGLYRFMAEQGLERLEFGQEGYQVRLVRRRPPQAAPSPTVVGQAPAASPAPSPGKAPTEVPTGGSVIRSPMMGIFYRAVSPSSPPFVKEGDSVKAGQVVCLVEAMKVFNEVKADSDGRVLQVLVENGKPVQSGQDLLVLTRR